MVSEWLIQWFFLVGLIDDYRLMNLNAVFWLFVACSPLQFAVASPGAAGRPLLDVSPAAGTSCCLEAFLDEIHDAKDQHQSSLAQQPHG